MAITWQNVNSPSFEGVGRMMEGAQTSVDAGLTGLLNILKQKQGLNQQIATDAFDARSEGAMGIISNFKTAAELQQAQDSGALEQQLAGLYGANGYDKKRVREFADTRKGWLMDQGIKVNTFESQEREKEKEALRRSQEPLYAEIQNKAYSNPAEARRMLAANPNLVGYGDLLALVDSESDQLYTRNRQSKLDTSAEAERAHNRRRADIRLARDLKTYAREDKTLAEQDSLKTAVTLARLQGQNYQDVETKHYAELGKAMGMGKPYNPITATADQRKQYAMLTEGFTDPVTGKKYAPRYTKAPDPDEYLAKARDNLSRSVSAPEFAVVSEMLPSLFNSGSAVSAQTSAATQKKLAQTAAVLDNYRKGGQYGASVDVYGADNVINAAQDYLNTTLDTLRANNKEKLGWLGMNAYQTDFEELAAENIMSVVQEGLTGERIDPKTGIATTVHYAFPIQEVKLAIDRLKDGNEQGATEYLKGLQESFATGNAKDPKAHNRRIDTLEELQQAQAMAANYRIAAGESELRKPLSEKK